MKTVYYVRLMKTKFSTDGNGIVFDRLKFVIHYMDEGTFNGWSKQPLKVTKAHSYKSHGSNYTKMDMEAHLGQ